MTIDELDCAKEYKYPDWPGARLTLVAIVEDGAVFKYGAYNDVNVIRLSAKQIESLKTLRELT